MINAQKKVSVDPFRARCHPTPEEAEQATLEIWMSQLPGAIANNISRWGLDLPPERNGYSCFRFMDDISGPGVYLIGDFYIGRSKNIPTRFYDHSRCATCGTEHSAVSRGTNAFKSIYGKVRVPVFKISSDPKNEKRMIETAIICGLPLTNVNDLPKIY